MHIMTERGWQMLNRPTVNKAEPTCRLFDQKAYDASVEAFCANIQEEIAESQARRLGV
jgi:hypothetical protein